MEYKVPFLCVDKSMKTKRIALGYYIQNLLSADKFDIESAMPVIKDFMRKDRDVLETNVPALVGFLGRVGSKEIRRPTDIVKDPTKWFCERLAKLLKAIKPTDYFLKRLGYAYVEADISHKWIQTFFKYKGPYKKVLLESMTYAMMDLININPHKTRGEDKDILRIFYDVYEKIVDPESLPAPLYLFLKECRRTYKIADWVKFIKNNLSFGRDQYENSFCLRTMISLATKRLDRDECAYDEKQSVIEGLKLLSKTNEAEYLAECISKKLKGISSRSEYLMYRGLVDDSLFSKYSKTVHKKVNPNLLLFAKAYEHPTNDIFFKKLSWKEKVMLYERFDRVKKKAIRDKCVFEFEKYLDLPYYKKELFYMFKILARGKKFLDKYLHDKRLFNKSLENSKFRILYLEKMHAVDDMFLKENKTVYTDDFYDDGSKTAIALSPSMNKKEKIIKYRCIIITVKDDGDGLICEVLTRKASSRYSVYSAVRYSGSGIAKAIYPNIDKRMALLFAQNIFSSGRKDIFSAAIEVHNQFSN